MAALAALSGAGLVIARASSADPAVEVVLPAPTASPVPLALDIRVYVSGAVARPGVYRVEEGDRLADLVTAAGGATADADLDRVNLAARLGDEDHWRIPVVGETAMPEVTVNGESAPDSGRTADAGPGGAGTSGDGRIDLNTADAEALTALPNIGVVKAAAIIAYREANGSFLEVDEIVEVQGIGDKTLEAIRPLVIVR